MVKVYLILRMEVYIKAPGEKANNMVLEYLQKTIRQKRESGKTELEFIGSPNNLDTKEWKNLLI